MYFFYYYCVLISIHKFWNVIMPYPKKSIGFGGKIVKICFRFEVVKFNECDSATVALTVVLL